MRKIKWQIAWVSAQALRRERVLFIVSEQNLKAIRQAILEYNHGAWPIFLKVRTSHENQRHLG